MYSLLQWTGSYCHNDKCLNCPTDFPQGKYTDNTLLQKARCQGYSVLEKGSPKLVQEKKEVCKSRCTGQLKEWVKIISWPYFLQAYSTCKGRYDDHRVSTVL